MTLPLLDRDTELIVNKAASIPYIMLTLDILKRFGIETDLKEKGTERMVFGIRGGQSYHHTSIHLEPDWSSAAYFLVAGEIAYTLKKGNRVMIDKLPRGTNQADEAIMAVLDQTSGSGYPYTVDATNCPDLFPVLVSLACFCNGTSTIRGVSRLLEKESNRAESIYQEFTLLGADIDIRDDMMYVNGCGGRNLHGGCVMSHNDHRIAMSLIIASLFIDGEVFLDDIKCIDKSFPSFLEKLKKI